MASNLIKNISFNLLSKRFLTFRDVKNGKQSSLVGDCKIVVTTKKENVCNISEGYLSKEVLRNSLIESDNSLDISAISGVPEGLFEARRVRIFMPAKNSMQSGTNDCHHWLLEFETNERWENPLMGWTSTGDSLSNLSIRFPDKEKAINFCKKNNWSYFVDEPVPIRKPKYKSYGDNFSWNQRTRVGNK